MGSAEPHLGSAKPSMLLAELRMGSAEPPWWSAEPLMGLAEPHMSRAGMSGSKPEAPEMVSMQTAKNTAITNRNYMALVSLPALAMQPGR